MRKRDVCIQFTSMAVNSIPNLRPPVVVSLNKNLLQSEKDLQTVGTEFNTGNAFGKYCPENGKRQMWTRKRKFCGYSLFGDSWIRYNAHLPSNKNDDSVRCCNICNIFSGDKSSNKIGIFHFWFTKLWKYFLCLFDHKSRCFCCFTIFAKNSYSLHIDKTIFKVADDQILFFLHPSLLCWLVWYVVSWKGTYARLIFLSNNCCMKNGGFSKVSNIETKVLIYRGVYVRNVSITIMVVSPQKSLFTFGQLVCKVWG